MTMDAGITLKNIGFGYPPDNKRSIFQDFSMDVSCRQVTAFLGPSGVGKSTLLGLIAGTIVPDEGAIQFWEHGRQTGRPPIGLVFQAATLIPWRTILSNALFGVELMQNRMRTRAATNARIMLAKYGLRGYDNRYPYELSGGMQQRVAIIRALVSGAKILLLDEPFSSSDFSARRVLQRDISEAVEQDGFTAVLVTH